MVLGGAEPPNARGDTRCWAPKARERDQNGAQPPRKASGLLTGPEAHPMGRGEEKTKACIAAELPGA